MDRRHSAASYVAKTLDLTAIGARVDAFLPKRPFPTTFVGFCAWLNVTLTPGQLALVSVAYDGLEPRDLPPEGRELAKLIFGDVDVIPPAARAVVAAVCGARSGKSYVLIALRMVYGALTRDLRSLAPGQKAVALIIGPNSTLRKEVVAYALGAMRSKPELAAMLVLPKGHRVEDSVADGFGIRRPDGQVVTFEAGIAGRAGYGGRGRSLTDFALDEVAFFRSEQFQVSDDEIFKAGTTRVLPGGLSILASTPWGESGLLYDFYSRNWGKPGDALVARAPTLVMHNSDMTREIVAREFARDPDNAEREYNANFMTSGTSVFFEATSLEAAIDESLTIAT